jgi:hypothetical protein
MLLHDSDLRLARKRATAVLCAVAPQYNGQKANSAKLGRFAWLRTIARFIGNDGKGAWTCAHLPAFLAAGFMIL